MTSVLSNAGIIFEGVISQVGTVASTITSTPLLMVFAMIPLIGLGVGLFKRLLNVN